MKKIAGLFFALIFPFLAFADDAGQAQILAKLPVAPAKLVSLSKNNVLVAPKPKQVVGLLLSDPACPYCRKHEPEYIQFAEDHGITLYVLPYNAIGGAKSKAAILASLAAAKQHKFAPVWLGVMAQGAAQQTADSTKAIAIQNGVKASEYAQAVQGKAISELYTKIGDAYQQLSPQMYPTIYFFVRDSKGKYADQVVVLNGAPTQDLWNKILSIKTA